MPDPDHFIKKHTPPVPVTTHDTVNTDTDTNTNVNWSVSQPVTTTVTVVTNTVACRPSVTGMPVNSPSMTMTLTNSQKHQQAGDVVSHEITSHSNPDMPASGMPPIQPSSGAQTPANSKMAEKLKKTSTGSNKKTTATHHGTTIGAPSYHSTNMGAPAHHGTTIGAPAHHGTTIGVSSHHSTTLAMQSTLQTEKTSLYEKSQPYSKMTNAKRRVREDRREERREERLVVDKKDGSVSLPEVRGAEGHQMKTNKSKKSFVATMPHIANIDPFSGDSQFNSSPSPEKEGNFPLV